MILKKHLITTAAIMSAGMLFAFPVGAQSVDIGMEFAGGIGLANVDIRTIVATIIRAALGFVGFILVLQIILSGFQIMASGGSEDARASAILGLKNSIIGFIIIMSASSITHFVVDAVVGATGGSIL